MDETTFQYEVDPRATKLATRVVRRGLHQGRSFVVLADTVLFPEGGGQPADRGRIDAARVVDVQKHQGEVRHFLGDELANDEVTVYLDWPRRFDLMQQHTGQHLLSAVAQDRFGWATTAFHLSESSADIELDVPQLDDESRLLLEDAVAHEIRAARAVRARRVRLSEYEALAVRTRGLPADHTGDVRLVEIDGLDLNTCGGTHLANTAEIETISLLDTEPMRGGTRLHFVCGQRARRRFARSESLLRQLRQALGANDDGLYDAALAKDLALREALRRERRTSMMLALVEAERLAVLAAPLAAHRFADCDAGFLNAVGQQFCRLAPNGVVALCCGSDDEGSLLLAAGPGYASDLRRLGAELVTQLDGRGGGTPRLFQAKVKNLAAWDAAVASLRSRLMAADS
ncbi:MAG: alanyl-tRNA editing protein [Acidobacteriota bacterium]